MTSSNIYCVYLTIYRGNKLPPFYIGSSSVKKVENGYHGSVKSREFEQIWLKELKENPSAFTTRIIKTTATRTEAVELENKFQKALNAVSNPLYTNKWFAIVNGFKGYDSSGKNNPMYGKKRPDSSERMKSNNPMRNKEISKRVALAKTGIPSPLRGTINTAQTKRLQNKNPMHNPESVKKMLENRTPEAVGKGMIWVANTKTKERTRIHPELFEEYSASGWIRLSNKAPIPD